MIQGKFYQRLDSYMDSSAISPMAYLLEYFSVWISGYMYSFTKEFEVFDLEVRSWF